MNRYGASPALLKWLGARLEAHAKDARQAEASVRCLDPVGYPYAHRLADVHAAVAALYEREVDAVINEIKEIK